MDYGYGGGNQYNNTSYGGQGGAGGGGFMPGSQTSPSGAKTRDFKDESVRPITIKQLNDAQDMGNQTDFMMDGKTFKTITFIGQVRKVAILETHIRYSIDDGTGVMEVKKWTDSAQKDRIQDGSMPNLPSQDDYVKVFGTLKAFNDKRHVGANFVRKIDDPNEIPHHFLEATLVHLQLTRGEPNAGNGATAGQNGGDSAMYDGYSAGAGGAGMNPKLARVSEHARQVYKFLETQPQGHEGLNVEVIAQAINLPINVAKRAGDELQDAGLTFATEDDGTWAILNMDI
ncbi:single-stranded DNA-binding replication protein A medium subunit [Microthyrium microscopicum]|uniref:Single-stranded DNA-binding replication protein A medium subunit n=1 Tax=Microthyrium microscopicum TaxID=703497 RepID=A0A6A6U5N7_9PEZI|nr:single-stranded DNA-binding replication protein A medium subunit [Microthyrium microscopicum]